MLEKIREGLKKSGKQMGRPRKTDYLALAKEESQAFDNTRQQWNYLAMSFAADLAAKLKKGETPNAQLVTSAAIAYDKAFSKRDHTDTVVSLPPILVQSVTKALIKQAVPVSDNKCYVTMSAQDKNHASPVDSQLILKTQDLVQVQAKDPGVGLPCDSTGGAGAAQPVMSAGQEHGNISEPAKSTK